MAEAGSISLASFCSYFLSCFSLEMFFSSSYCPLDGQEQDSSVQQREDDFYLVPATSRAHLSRH